MSNNLDHANLPLLGRALTDTLYWDGPDTEWDSSMMEELAEVLELYEDAGETGGRNAEVYAAAREWLPEDDDWDSDATTEIARELEVRGFKP